MRFIIWTIVKLIICIQINENGCFCVSFGSDTKIIGTQNPFEQEPCDENLDFCPKRTSTKTSTKRNKCRHPVELALEDFSRSLIPSSKYIQDGTTAAAEIISVLRKNMPEICRVLFGGSMVKKTALNYPGIPPSDFDFLVFLSYKTGDFTKHPHSWQKIVDRMNSILNNSTKLPHKVELRRLGQKFLCSCEYRGYSFDFNPILDYVSHKNKNKNKMKTTTMDGFPFDHPQEKLTWDIYDQEQLEKILEKISSLPNPIQHHRRYNSGLAETEIRWFQNLPTDLQSLIRIAKFWGKKLTLKKFERMRSFPSLMGTLAIYVYSTLLSGKNPETDFSSMPLTTSLDSFFQVILEMEWPQNFSVSLNESQKLQLLQIQSPKGRSSSSAFPYINFSHYMNVSCHRRPFISDLFNPFGNLAVVHTHESTRKEIWRVLIDKARISRKMLQQVLAGNESDVDNQEIDILKILS